MGEEELNNLPSVQGYINWDELTRVLLNGVGQTTLWGFATMVVVALGESAHMWYTGPAGPTVIFVLTSIAAYMRSKALAKKFIQEGDNDS